MMARARHPRRWPRSRSQRSGPGETSMRIAVVLAGLLALLRPALADEVFVATASSIADEKAVFATVETANVAPARARIGGTIAQLTVRQGDRVEAGQVVATVGDAKLVLQMKALDAQIAGLQAQSAKAQEDLARAQGLFERGTTPKVRLDEARTAAEVASTALRSRIAERSVIEQQLSEGQVLAPASGRVLRVPLTAGSVVLPGEVIATVAERGFVLRLRVPERHARFLKAGDPVRIDGAEIGQSGVRFG